VLERLRDLRGVFVENSRELVRDRTNGSLPFSVVMVAWRQEYRIFCEIFKKAPLNEGLCKVALP
jgi:hypothetical protein